MAPFLPKEQGYIPGMLSNARFHRSRYHIAPMFQPLFQSLAADSTDCKATIRISIKQNILGRYKTGPYI